MVRLATKFRPDHEFFQLATDAGFECAEFWLNASLLEDHEPLARLASQYELGYALHCPNRAELSDLQLKQLAALYERIDSELMVIHAPMHEQYGKTLSSLAPEMCLAVENHQLSPAEFQHWAEVYPFLTLDVEHLWKYTLWDAPLATLESRLQDFLRQFHHKLVHVHLPGYVPGWAEHRPMYCSREMTYMVLSALDEHGYDGFVVGETSLEFQNEYDLRMDVLLFERWQKVWGKLGDEEQAA